jgi:hypothetical protein
MEDEQFVGKNFVESYDGELKGLAHFVAPFCESYSCGRVSSSLEERQTPFLRILEHGARGLRAGFAIALNLDANPIERTLAAGL